MAIGRPSLRFLCLFFFKSLPSLLPPASGIGPMLRWFLLSPASSWPRSKESNSGDIESNHFEQRRSSIVGSMRRPLSTDEEYLQQKSHVELLWNTSSFSSFVSKLNTNIRTTKNIG
ncbi:hypothetical protein KP509_30G075600 [Ceratopteris richardii]|uniref:Uncharacterized protein n=1 Tax=Ceratopteris richardii TaxID=49495 RepID=A0A8T2R659_CERRI|nr:hypothetical protein KP509_30G075600 [Ceratopteris richardii]